MFKQQELNMLGKTGLILFIPSDFSWVHEAQISKATYKLNQIQKHSKAQAVWGMINPNKLINITFYNEGQH